MSDLWKVDSMRPPTQHREEIESMLGAMGAFKAIDVVYLACPITGGRRHLDWLRGLNGSCGIDHRSAVIEPNLEAANAFCQRVQAATGKTCLNPAALHRSVWNQDDYRHFWSRAIQAFATCVYLSEGWEFSIGCIFECLLAVRLGLPLFDHGMEPMPDGKAVDTALAGIRTLIQSGESREFLSLLLREFLLLHGTGCPNGST